jgi:pullulanase
VKHPQVDYSKVNYSKAPWAKEPYQTITYAECHDNHTLWDRLTLSCPDASEEDRIKMQKLAMTIVLTSQGVPFLHAGMEMLRTKNGVENSFNSPDEINRFDWDRKTKYLAFNDYVRQLIQLRKNHPAFRMHTADLIRRNIKFLETNDPNLIVYQIGLRANNDTWTRIVVIYNGNAEERFVTLPKGGTYNIVLDDTQIVETGIKTLISPKVGVPGMSAMILVE